MLHFPRWQVITIVVVCVFGVLFSLPNLFAERTLESLPSWIPKRQVALGLDLQGGSHLLLEVNFAAAFAERMNGVLDGVRAKMRDARIGYTGLSAQGDSVVFTVRDKDRIAEIPDLIRQVDADLETRTTPDGAVTLRFSERALQAAKRSMLDQSIEIVRRRI